MPTKVESNQHYISRVLSDEINPVLDGVRLRYWPGRNPQTAGAATEAGRIESWDKDGPIEIVASSNSSKELRQWVDGFVAALDITNRLRTNELVAHVARRSGGKS